MIDLESLARELEARGAKHAPEQFVICSHCERPYPDRPDGRYVTAWDAPGVYYVLGTDNLEDRPNGPEDRAQVLFLGVPIEENYADGIDGYKISKIEQLPVAGYATTCFAMWIERAPNGDDSGRREA